MKIQDLRTGRFVRVEIEVVASNCRLFLLGLYLTHTHTNAIVFSVSRANRNEFSWLDSASLIQVPRWYFLLFVDLCCPQFPREKREQCTSELIGNINKRLIPHRKGDSPLASFRVQFTERRRDVSTRRYRQVANRLTGTEEQCCAPPPQSKRGEAA